ncbi:MAG: hypothetical protein JWN91_2610 [Nocardioides sp.]|jgi:hypothetical protein|nr:hypothetical protein [Nocardioides sp.]
MTRLISVRRGLAALAVTPVLLTGLVACGGGDDGGSAATDPVASSGSSESSAPADGGLEAGDSVEPADFADRMAEGFASMTTAHATMSGDLGSQMHGEGDVDYGGDSPSSAMTVSGMMGAGDTDVRLIDGVMYMNLGQLSKGKFWKIDLNDPNSPFGSLGSQLDVKSSVELLEKGMTSVEYVGAEDGLDHFTATVDPSVLLEAMGPEASSGASTLPKSLDYDIWLDEDNRVNKLSFTLGKLGTLEMTLSDFGKDVTIEAPPADQVTDMPDMFSSPGDPAA